MKHAKGSLKLLERTSCRGWTIPLENLSQLARLNVSKVLQNEYPPLPIAGQHLWYQGSHLGDCLEKLERGPLGK